MNRNFIAARLTLLLAFACASLATITAGPAPTVTHAFETSRPAQGVQRVVIEVPTGDITIRNGASSTISIRGTASREYEGTRERDWAQKVVNASSIDAYVSGSEAIVRRRFTGDADTFRAQKFTTFKVVIEVPAGTEVDVETDYGDVRIEGVFSSIDSSLKAGEIFFRAPRSTVKELNASCRVGEVEANLGSETIKREGLFPGRTHFYNPTGTTVANLHVTAGEVKVELAQ